MAENILTFWFKRIFTVQTFTATIGAASLIIGVISLINSTSGELSIQVNQEIIPLPETEYQTTRIAELCLVNDSTINLNGKSKIPELKNLSSRAINNLYYEILIKTKEDVEYQLGDEFEKSNYKARFKYENLKAFQSVSGPIEHISFSQSQIYIQFIYNIAFDGVKEPIIFTYDLYILNNRGKNLSEENYLSLRNSFLKKCYENFKDEDKDNKIIVTVGDTTVNVNNPKYLNLDESPLASLSDLEKDIDKHIHLPNFSDCYVFIFFFGVFIFACFHVIEEVSIIRDFYKRNNRLPNNSELKKNNSGYGYIYVIYALVLPIIFFGITLYYIYQTFFI